MGTRAGPFGGFEILQIASVGNGRAKYFQRCGLRPGTTGGPTHQGCQPRIGLNGEDVSARAGTMRGGKAKDAHICPDVPDGVSGLNAMGRKFIEILEVGPIQRTEIGKRGSRGHIELGRAKSSGQATAKHEVSARVCDHTS